MFSALLKHRGRRREPKNPAGPIPFQIECICGKRLTGQRGDKAVATPCASCGQSILVFPTSPLIELRQTIRDGLQHVAASKSAAKTGTKPALWRRPLLAAGMTLVIVIAIVLIVATSSLFRSGQPNTASDDAVLREEMLAAQRALSEQAYSEAARRFRNARNALKDRDAKQGRRLEQMEREASMMADLLGESLQEILQHAKDLGERAWSNQFRARYQDKAILFDDFVQSAGGGVLRIDYPVLAAGGVARVEIHNPPALRNLNVRWPMRMLIGVRLAEVRRDTRGQWIVVARPDSLVLFTERAMFHGSSVPVDADMAELLGKQAALLDIAPP